MQAKDHLIVALDTREEADVINLVEKLSGKVGYFKVGLELFTSLGPKIVKLIKERGDKVFFDGKFLDIPNTVSKAVANMVKHKVDMLNIHLSGGKKMLEEARRLLAETALQEKLQAPKLLGVTVLTSITNDILQNDLKIKSQIEEYVSHLTKFALSVSLDGIICSPNEAKIVREVSKENKDFLIITPGVRPTWAKANDQERIATPKEAILNGASHIVIGRPITSANNPLDAVKKILEEIEGAKV